VIYYSGCEVKLLFQTLDDKTECVGIYADNQLIFDLDGFPPELTQTWKYAPYLRDLDIEYISLYLEGGKIGDAIPEYLGYLRELLF
jgi:hypothetical protein